MLVVRTKLADEDLLDIWFYVGADDMDAADRLLDQIDTRCDNLSQYPQKGVQRDALMPGMRSILEGNYVIFYQVNGDRVEILRILHGSRDFPSIF
jgi:toxin ParE1/3/4